MPVETIKQAIEQNVAATVASICLMVYFFGTAIVFIAKPLKYGRNYSIQPVDNAGKTEIRVYYGAISAALGLFLGFLAFVCAKPFYALCGGLFFSNAVFWTRLIFTFVDKGWNCPYTKLAIPAEGAFILSLWICFIISMVAENGGI